jgi:hypothetical protein
MDMVFFSTGNCDSYVLTILSILFNFVSLG